jgi:tetratricopeptide (TPR) repeat protein
MLDEELFHRALDKPTLAEQLAFLDQACADQPELRQRVERLLRSHRHEDSFLHPPATTDEALSEKTGTVIGPYKLIEQIGEGGMGTVWMAQQAEPVKRLVAVKLIKAGMDSRQVIARFEAEQQALALMDHPNIAKVHDAGTTPDGRPFFVMELVKGVPITKYCDGQRLTPRQRLELCVPVSQAIHHAHQKGIIHRDIKPSNVLVALYDDRPVPKVIDFGIAKATGQQLTDQTLHTGFGAVVGTLEYMSPEQANLNNVDIDTRSDIYSLGVLLYELLTGSPPLLRKELERAGMLEMLRVIREQEPARPSIRLSTAEGLPTLAANRGMEPARLARLVRGELDWIVMKALEKDRSRRYDSANAFAADLLRYLADEPVLACPPSTWYRFGKFARRNKARLALVAAIFLALTVMAATIGWAARDRSARAEESERAEVARRAQVETQVRESWQAARTLLAENRVAAARQKLVKARAQLGSDRAVLTDLAADIDSGAAQLDRFQQFLDLVERAHQAESAPPAAAASEDRGAMLITAKPTGVSHLYTAARRPAAAVPFLLQALQRYQILERDDWNTILEGGILGKHQVAHIRRLAYEELLWLADDVTGRHRDHRSGDRVTPQAAAEQALVYLGKAEKAHPPTQAFYGLRAGCRKTLKEEAAFQADRRLADRTAPTLAVDHHRRGVAAMDAGKMAEGVEAFEAALRLEPTHYWSLARLGSCWLMLSQRPEDAVTAAAVFTGCIMARPDGTDAYLLRGSAYVRLGRLAAALDDWGTAIKLEPKHPLAWYNRGTTYLNLGRPEEAVADLSRAVELDPNYAHAWTNLGHAHLKLRQLDRSIADYTRAILLAPNDTFAWHGRGYAYFSRAQYEKAITNYTRATELAPNYVRSWQNLGAAHSMLGQYDKALAACSRAIALDPKNGHLWHGQGVAYAGLGQYDKAVAAYTQAIQLSREYKYAYLSRGVVYCDHLRQPEKAVADFTRAIALDPKVALAWYNRGVAYRNLRQYDKAIEDYSKAIALDPKVAAAWYARGVAYRDLRQYDKAVEDYSKAIELHPERVAVRVERGIAYCDFLDRPDKAVDDFTRAIALEPKNAVIWFNRGNAYYKLGKQDQAVIEFSQAIELDAKFASAWSCRGDAYNRLGQFNRALEDYQTAIKVAPNGAKVHNALAWFLATCPDARVRDPKRAVTLAERAVQLAPDNGHHWGTLGTAYYRAGAWNMAVTALDKSRKLKTGWDAYHWLFLAMTHRKLGNAAEARRMYDQAIEWLDRNQKLLATDKVQAEELRRFRSEAEAVLKLMK